LELSYTTHAEPADIIHVTSSVLGEAWLLKKTIFIDDFSQFVFNLTAQRCRSATENFILEDLFKSVLSQIEKISPLWKPKI